MIKAGFFFSRIKKLRVTKWPYPTQTLSSSFSGRVSVAFVGTILSLRFLNSTKPDYILTYLISKSFHVFPLRRIPDLPSLISFNLRKFGTSSQLASINHFRFTVRNFYTSLYYRFRRHHHRWRSKQQVNKPSKRILHKTVQFSSIFESFYRVTCNDCAC